MATAGTVALPPGFRGFAQTPGGQNFFMMLGVAAIVGVMAAVYLWSQQPDYRVLFSNYSDRDGGAIVASLQQQNIPYKFAEGGGAILVPSNQVHDARLKLAAQGLPKGGSVGFELMENQKLGVSQFLEQVNFQRALEGELARSIQSVSSVQAARVHLALPKASVFVREQQKPTASVLLNLHAGRTLDQQQVSAIVHLVASSVPDLPIKNVTVVDQSGNLLSDTSKANSNKGLDPAQLKYLQDIQQDIAKRIESIITPIVGPNNVRAEATADVDFSSIEQAAEVYKPNQAPTTASIRSQQTSETQNATGNPQSGIPGALSNQPPAPATAPIVATPPAGTAAIAPAAGAGTPNPLLAPLPQTPGNAHRDTTINYEVDKTIRYVQQPMGGVKRLSVAVVVNFKREVAKDGKVTMVARSEAEKAQITDLVKEAMGFNKDRGDTLNVVTSPFAAAEKETIVETPIWKRAEVWDLAGYYGKYFLGFIILAYLFFGMLRPMLKNLAKNFTARQEMEQAALEHEEEQEEAAAVSGYQENLQVARQMAKQDPKVVANVVKGWVGVGNE
ncbi:flagellar basal-body MS-ring/collar protein FliF [soil metagenome]